MALLFSKVTMTGRYSRRNQEGKRVAQTVYAKTKDDCEAKLAELVARMREEWIAKKNVMESTEMVEPAMRI